MSNIRFDMKNKKELKFLRGIHQDIRSIRSKNCYNLDTNYKGR